MLTNAKRRRRRTAGSSEGLRARFCPGPKIYIKPDLVEKTRTGEKTGTRRKAKPVGPRCYRLGRTYAARPGRSEKGVALFRVLSAEREVLEEITE